MKHAMAVVLLLLSSAFADDISLSKDSLKAGNAASSLKIDSVIIQNNSPDSIFLDSAYLIFDVFDTSGMTAYTPSHNKIEVYWREPLNKSDFGWHMNEIAGNTYKLAKDYFYPNDAIPLRCSPGGKCDLNGLRIGFYLVSSHFPVYPKYLCGKLRLYFNAGRVEEITLYSDDLRTSVIREHLGKRGKGMLCMLRNDCFTISGRKIAQIGTAGRNIYITDVNNGRKQGNSKPGIRWKLRGNVR